MDIPTPSLMCPQCHLPVQPEFYFCPNCGKELRGKPLSTSPGTQAWIYALSVVMPLICFLGISYWPGVKYMRSDDPQAKQIGIVAAALMALSTVITIWLAVVWVQETVQSSLSSVGNLGGF